MIASTNDDKRGIMRCS